MARLNASQQVYLRLGGVIVFSTLVLTFSFLGVYAFVSGEFETALSQLPWYLLVGALAFVGSIVLLEQVGSEGIDVIVTGTVYGIFAMLLAALTGEGVLYTINNLEDVLQTQLAIIFLAAGFAGTGIAYWALNHWREFTRAGNRL